MNARAVKRRHHTVPPFHGSCIRLLNVSAGQAPQLRTVAATRLKHLPISYRTLRTGRTSRPVRKLQDSSREPRAPVGQANWGQSDFRETSLQLDLAVAPQRHRR